MEGAVFAKENQCEFIVALSGGSVMGASKIIAIMVTNPGPELMEIVTPTR